MTPSERWTAEASIHGMRSVAVRPSFLFTWKNIKSTLMYSVNEIKNKIICGNALTELRNFPDNCIDCCVTSPPYWGLREYNTEPKVWGGDINCVHEWIEKPRRNRKSNAHSPA